MLLSPVIFVLLVTISFKNTVLKVVNELVNIFLPESVKMSVVQPVDSCTSMWSAIILLFDPWLLCQAFPLKSM